MKGGLLVPTGNAECDLLSFAAKGQFSATSPELPTSERNHATSSITNDGFANCAWRPLTGPSLCKNKNRKSQQSRCKSANEPRWKNRANMVYEIWSNDDTGDPRHRLHFPKTNRIESVPTSIQKTQTQLHASKASGILERTTKRTLNKEGETGAKLHGRLLLDLRYERKSPPQIQAGLCTESILDKGEVKKKPEIRRRLPKTKTKKSKKNVQWKNSIVPLPSGSDFDNLIRSGGIAKHIAKRERKRRCW